MKIGITGASGMLGRETRNVLVEAGHGVVGFSRNPKSDDVRSFREPLDVSGLDAIIHLAGEPIVGLWTADKKRRILESREQGTRLVANAIKASSSPPSVLISASGTNFYPSSGDQELDESAAAGDSFLSDVCVRWEAEALKAASTSTRVAPIRFGMIVSDQGGAGKLLYSIFRTGLGGRVGSGAQWMPWIHLHDAARLILHALETESLSGPINGTTPNPVTNHEFTKILGAVAKRPAILPIPAFALRTVLGGLSCLALDSIRAVPTKATDTGFEFHHSELDGALRDLFPHPSN